MVRLLLAIDSMYIWKILLVANYTTHHQPIHEWEND